MKVVAFKREHLDKVAELHMWAFKDHLNVLLGQKYIRSFLRWFIDAPGCVNVAGLDADDNVEGYIVGAPWGYQKQMNKDLVSTASIEMLKRPWIFLHKKILRSVWLRLKTMLGLNTFIKTTQQKYSGKIISLVGIGVSKKAVGTGLAMSMMERFIEHAKKQEYDYARLSVYSSNVRARTFYEKMGWTLEDTTNSIVGYFKKIR